MNRVQDAKDTAAASTLDLRPKQASKDVAGRAVGQLMLESAGDPNPKTGSPPSNSPGSEGKEEKIASNTNPKGGEPKIAAFRPFGSESTSETAAKLDLFQDDEQLDDFQEQQKSEGGDLSFLGPEQMAVRPSLVRRISSLSKVYTHVSNFPHHLSADL